MWKLLGILTIILLLRETLSYIDDDYSLTFLIYNGIFFSLPVIYISDI